MSPSIRPTIQRRARAKRLVAGDCTDCARSQRGGKALLRVAVTLEPPLFAPKARIPVGVTSFPGTVGGNILHQEPHTRGSGKEAHAVLSRRRGTGPARLPRLALVSDNQTNQILGKAMTRAVIKSVVEEFLDSKKPEVLAISGKWGVGKTYALQEMVRAYEGGNSLAWYSYISAFGAKSIGDLRSMILVKTRPFPVKKGRVGDAVEEAEALFAKGRGGAIYKAAMAFLEKVPYGGKQVTVLLETVATSLIRRTVVCIDDIERLGSGITMDELMGLVSELKVESQCKVILLFNEEQLGERAKQYEQASEKVVDKKLAFMTTASEAVDFGLPSDTPLREYVIPCVEKLGISNIRTVQKIANGLQTVHRVIPNCSDAVNQQAAIAVAVFAGALYEGGIGFPNPEQVVIYNWYSNAMGVGKDTIEESWREKLQACGFLACDKFDTEVLSVLRNGFAHGSELARYAQELDEVADRGRLDGIFTEAWNMFHDRIDGTAEELMLKFVSAVEVAATVISPLNLNSTVKLLRELGFSSEADELIEKYVQLNAGRTGLFKIDDSP